jgi:glycosyltransferase involved in cell wall biosynthesis
MAMPEPRRAGGDRQSAENRTSWSSRLRSPALRKIRVLHVIPQVSGHGGAEISLRDNVVAASGSYLEQAIVVLNRTDNEMDPFIQAGVPVRVPSNHLSRVGAVRHVLASIRDFTPDVVHSSLFEADLAARIAATATSTRVVCSLVNTGYSEYALAAQPVSRAKLRMVKSLDGFLARQATTAFHAISEATASHAVEHLRIPRSRIRVVPRGRDADSIGERTPGRRRRVRESEGWVDRSVILNVARQEPQKGHEHLLQAFHQVVEVHPQALLVQVGREGRNTHTIRRLVDELQLTDAVQFLGVRSDIADLLVGADVFGFSSLWEGLGGAVVEAAAAALPIVSFDVPAIREVVGPDHPWLVPIGDASRLGDALCEVVEAGEFATASIGQAQRKRFLEHYELGAVVEEMKSFYRDVVVSSSTRRSAALRRVPVIEGPVQRSD